MSLKKVIAGAIGSVVIVVGGYFGLSQTDSNKIVSQVESLFKEEVVLEEHEAEVVRVVDGDTVIVKTDEGAEERVRLLLIDTPESVHPTEPEQLFGKESSEYAKEVLKEGDVIKLEIGKPERDRYDRLLAYIWIDDVNFNQLMIEKGYARVGYVYEPNTKYLNEFEKAEREAKDERKNIWSIDGYVTEDGFDMSVVN